MCTFYIFYMSALSIIYVHDIYPICAWYLFYMYMLSILCVHDIYSMCAHCLFSLWSKKTYIKHSQIIIVWYNYYSLVTDGEQAATSSGCLYSGLAHPHSFITLFCRQDFRQAYTIIMIVGHWWWLTIIKHWSPKD